MKRSPLRAGKKCRECSGHGCSNCGHQGFIFKSLKKRRSVPKIKDKKLAQDIEYAVMRKAFLLANRRCQCLNPKGRCVNPPDQVHHRRGRNEYYLNQSTWMAVCFECHEKIHNNPEWARRMGYMVNRASNKPTPEVSATFLPYEPPDDVSH